MNKFLRSAADRFNNIKEKEYLISPISEIDAEIIIELGQIIKKVGISDVFEILNTYKEQKDSDIRDQLLQWNIDHPKSKDSIKQLDKRGQSPLGELLKNVIYPPFIELEDLILRIYDLKGIKLFERFDADIGNYKFGMIINPTPILAKSIPLYSNHIIEYYSDENRKIVLEKIRSVFKENNTEFLQIT